MLEDIYEVRWHGRGGQGAKTGAQLLAEAALDAGKYIQAFPEYGPERSGAPMKAYDRISDHPINVHSQVETPNIVLVVDPTLLDSIDVTEGLLDDGSIIVNTTLSPDEIKSKLKKQNVKVYTVDATGISIKTIGRNMPNTPMLGAFSKVTGLIPIDVISEKFKKKFLKKIGEAGVNKNIEALKMAYEEVKQ